MNPLDNQINEAIQQGRISVDKTWFIRAIEEHNPRMTLALACSEFYPYMSGLDEALLAVSQIAVIKSNLN